MASRDQAEYVYADICPADADDKTRPDGTDVFRSRRPGLYRPIASDPTAQVLPPMRGATEMVAAVVTLADTDDLQEACAQVATAVEQGAQLIALPPLVPAADDPAASAAFALEAIPALASACGDAVVTTALVVGETAAWQHCAVVVGKSGLLLQQGQVHPSNRFDWSTPAAGFLSVELPFGRLAVVTSDDSIYPETFRLLALAGVEVCTVPLSPLENWELETGLLERSAENRILPVRPSIVEG